LDQSQVTLLRVEGPTVSGLLNGVDPDKGIVVISIPRGRTEADEKNYSVAKDVRILLEGTEVKLSDLKVQDNGPILQMRLTLDQQAVQVIVAGQARGQ
jgi:hypothetical protein